MFTIRLNSWQYVAVVAALALAMAFVLAQLTKSLGAAWHNVPGIGEQQENAVHYSKAYLLGPINL